MTDGIATINPMDPLTWPLPAQTTTCSLSSRPEYTSIPSHEFLDDDTVLSIKIRLLASMIRNASHVSAYTGAGLSVASGLADYASKAPDTVSQRSGPSSPLSPSQGSGFLAQPNLGHRFLASLFHSGLLHVVVNQNHDGLLQKAGYPQYALNEIHGSWFDPSNPGGNILRDDLFDAVLETEQKTNLCLALGTSLSGLNADRVAETAAKKFCEKKGGLGLLIVNLQQTRLDDICTLRIYGILDDVLNRLAMELCLPNSVEMVPVPVKEGDVYTLPYDGDSGLLSETLSCVLDLRQGSKIRVLGGNMDGQVGIVGKKNEEGHYRIQISVPVDDMPDVHITHDHLLGSWWLAEAQRGLVPRLPVLNT